MHTRLGVRSRPGRPTRLGSRRAAEGGAGGAATLAAMDALSPLYSWASASGELVIEDTDGSAGWNAYNYMTYMQACDLSGIANADLTLFQRQGTVGRTLYVWWDASAERLYLQVDNTAGSFHDRYFVTRTYAQMQATGFIHAQFYKDHFTGIWFGRTNAETTGGTATQSGANSGTKETGSAGDNILVGQAGLTLGPGAIYSEQPSAATVQAAAVADGFY